VLVFIYNVLRSRKHGAIAGNDPWGAPTLEWSIPSPPPEYNYATIPTVTSRYPMWDLKSPELTKDVPHTREVPVVGSAGSAEQAERLGMSPSRYEGPTGIVGVTHDMANRSGLPSISFWAAVPHYIPAGVNPKATLALVERLAQFLEVDVDIGDLRPAAETWEQSISKQVEENEALSGYVQRLEEAGAEDFNLTDQSGDDIAAEIERFLEERGTEGT